RNDNWQTPFNPFATRKRSRRVQPPVALAQHSDRTSIAVGRCAHGSNVLQPPRQKIIELSCEPGCCLELALQRHQVDLIKPYGKIRCRAGQIITEDYSQ